MCKKSKTKEKSKNNSKNGKKKLTEVFFGNLGRFITKRYKIILIISLLSAVSAIYPAILLSGELSYNDTDFLNHLYSVDAKVMCINQDYDRNCGLDDVINHFNIKFIPYTDSISTTEIRKRVNEKM